MSSLQNLSDEQLLALAEARGVRPKPSAVQDIGQGFMRGINQLATGVSQIALEAAPETTASFVSLFTPGLRDTLGGLPPEQFAAGIEKVKGNLQQRAADLRPTESTSTLNYLAAGLPETLALLPVAGAAGLSMPARAAVGAAESGALGFLQPTAEGESRALNTAVSATLGGAFTAGAPAVFQKAKAFFQKPAKEAAEEVVKAPLTDRVIQGATEGVAAAKEGAEGVVGKVVRRFKEASLPPSLKALPPEERLIAQDIIASGLDIDEALSRAAEDAKFGLRTPIYELLDSPTLRQVADNVSQFSGGSKVASQAIADLSARRIPAAINRGLRTLTNSKLTPYQQGEVLRDYSDRIFKRLIDERRVKAKSLYDAALKPGNLVPGLDEALNDPFIKALLKKMRADPLKARVMAKADNAMPTLDALKKQLDDIGQIAERSMDRRDKLKSKLVLELRDKIVSAADKKYPQYRQARAMFSSDSEVIEQLKETPLGIIHDLSHGKLETAGRKLLDSDPSVIRELRDQFTRMPGGDSVFNSGIVSALQQRFDETFTNSPGQFAKSLFGKPILDKRLKAALDNTTYTQLKKFAQSLDRNVSAVRAVGQNSKTFQRQQAAALLTDKIGDGTALTRARGIKEAALDQFSSILENAYAKSVLDDPEGAQRLARFLFTKEGVKLLRKLKNTELGTAANKKATLAVLLAAGQYKAATGVDDGN